jgi:hypothetical protein
MNRVEKPFSPGPEAELQYLQTEFRVRKHGTFVRCAVTSEPILLEDLRYWSVDLQEPYSGPAAVMQRVKALAAAGSGDGNPA